MAQPSHPRSVRVITGEIDSTVVTTRLVLPTPAQPDWNPFQRVAESVGTRERQLPLHAHQHAEVLTYVTEGFASYQLEAGPIEPLQRGSGRLLTAPGQVSHRVSPAKGGAIRWFSLVVALPPNASGAPRLQSIGPQAPTMEEDTVHIRPVVGPRAPMASSAGLECHVLKFTDEGTTFRSVGTDRRAVLYAISGRGSVDHRDIEAGQAALIEGMPAVAVQGDSGFCAILATAPG
jgi:redox-sensitive bicupin YhaK (pirin superfamily)